ncbi:MAG: hypothetical protein PHU48_06815, partial [Candidatus Cloacimonetes bacterium]|nr:hypothetical protein [Candidatus Cloacimonadota bacterium]
MPKKALMILGLMLLTGFIWGQVPIFNEAVPTFTDLPAGWTSNNGGGQAIMQTAKNGYLLVDHADDWVVSSAYDLSNYVSVELLFSVASYGSGDNNPL